MIERRAFLKAITVGLVMGSWAFAKEKAKNLYSRYNEFKLPPRKLGGYGIRTAEDIEGPFYRANAPFQSNLAKKKEAGKKLCVRGRVVRSPECTPVKGAVIDVWQASAKGRYDNDDPKKLPGSKKFRLRGRIRCDSKGGFEFRTVWPGHYQIGPKRWRPAHLHAKVTAPGYRSITTQLYFKEDPYNKGDPWFDPSRVLHPKKAKDGTWVATYEIVLDPVVKRGKKKTKPSTKTSKD